MQATPADNIGTKVLQTGGGQHLSRETANKIADALGLAKEIYELNLTFDWKKNIFMAEWKGNSVIREDQGEKIAAIFDAT